MFVRWATPQPGIDVTLSAHSSHDQQRTGQPIQCHGLRRGVIVAAAELVDPRLTTRALAHAMENTLVPSNERGGFP